MGHRSGYLGVLELPGNKTTYPTAVTPEPGHRLPLGAVDQDLGVAIGLTRALSRRLEVSESGGQGNGRLPLLVHVRSRWTLIVGSA